MSSPSSSSVTVVSTSNRPASKMMVPDAAGSQAQAQPQAKAKSAKPPKAAKPDGTEDGAGAPKGKSAKELKKEKRAALVAARGGGGAGEAGPSSNPDAASHSHSQNGSPAQAGAGGGGASRPGMPHATSSFIPQPTPVRRPPILSSDSTLPAFTQAQQDLFFSHLPAHKSPNTREAFESGRVHPIVVRLGVMTASGTLRGANARTIGMMRAFQEVIRDYETPESAVMWKDLMSHMSPMITFLEGCRPKGQGGGNAIRWLKSEINRIGEEGGRSELEQREYLIKAIDAYLEARIDLADQVISDTAREKIRPGETIVTYARSSVVERVLLDAWSDMRENDPEASFSVVVVDSRPLNEGRNLLDSLTSAGLPCTYVLLTQAAHLISRSSLVLLGASALHSDGALYSRAGTAMIAMMAKEHRVPVVACVETYKFGERVQLDGVANNELGIGTEIFTVPPESGKTGVEIKTDLRPSVTPLCLLYDLTPPELITAVCTEIGFIPPSSVPTVLGKGSGVQ